MWQLTHWAVTLTWVWFHFDGVQPLTLWQLKQPVEPTGMCVADLPVAAVPLWHDAQFVVALNTVWSTLADDQLLVDLWQLSQLPLTPAWMALDGLPAAGAKPPLWQLAQPLVKVTLVCTLAADQLPKPDLWQLSQLTAASAGTDA